MQNKILRFVKFAFWNFVHNAIIHPPMAFPWIPRWLQVAHDWTADQAYGEETA
jgi:hypothetical protein